MLLLLDDDPRRVGRLQAVFRQVDPAGECRVWSNAYEMIAEVGPLLPSASLISLDHDLEVGTSDHDPGDGLVLVKWLVAQPLRCPVIIHSSNAEGARRMIGELELAGWRQRWRVPAIGEDWIEADWAVVARRAIDDGSARAFGR
jgi:hypothetical protein